MHSFSPKVINYSKEEGLKSCFMSNALSDMRESKTISMIFCHAILVRDKNPFIVVSKIASLQLPEMISTMAFISMQIYYILAMNYFNACVKNFAYRIL